MKKFLHLGLLGSLALAGLNQAHAINGYPDQLYVPGTMNGWQLDNQTLMRDWILAEDETNPALYSGQFIIENEMLENGALEFKISGTPYWGDLDWGSYDWAGFDLYKDWNHVEDLAERGNNFKINNWSYGTLELTVDLQSMKIEINSPTQPEFVFPSVLYVCGDMNGWNYDNEELMADWVLTPVSEFTPELYSATFNVERGALNFKILSDLNWDSNYGCDEYPFSLYGNALKSLNLNPWGNNIECNNWAGGTIDITVNWKTKEITLDGFTQPEYVEPNLLYLIGNFNQWTLPISEDFETSGGIILTSIEDGVFAGEINCEVPEEGLQFQIFDGLYGWNEFHNYGALYNNNQVILHGESVNWEIGIGFGDIVVSNWKENGSIRVDMNQKRVTITSEEVNPPQVYINGDFTDWNNVELTLTGEGENIYKGTITNETAGEHWFNLEIGSYYYGLNTPPISLYRDQEYKFTLNQYGSIYISNWEGGDLNITFNLDTMEVLFEAPDQPTYLETVSAIYLVGNFNGWNVPVYYSSNEDFEKEGGIILSPTQEPGIYEGLVNINGNDYDNQIEFKIFDGKYNWGEGHDFGATDYQLINLTAEETYSWDMISYNGENYTIVNWLNEGKITVNLNNMTVSVMSEEVYVPTYYVIFPYAENPLKIELKSTSSDPNIVSADFEYEGEFYLYIENEKGLTYSSPEKPTFNVYQDNPAIVKLDTWGYQIFVSNWQGGLCQISLNTETFELEIAGPEQPTVDESMPEKLSVCGNITNWEPSEIWYLTPKGGENGVYYGILENLPTTDEGLNFYLAYTLNNSEELNQLGPDRGEFNLYSDTTITGSTNPWGGWYIKNWTLGTLELEINIVENTFILSSPTQPTATENNVLYLIGDNMSWDQYYSEYVLYPVEGESNVYEGEFIYYGYGYDCYFRFYRALVGNWEEYSIGTSNYSSVWTDLSKHPSTWTGYLAEGSQGCWVLPEWNEFPVKMRVDLNNNIVEFETNLLPSKIQVVGEGIKEGDYILETTGDGIYSGTFFVDYSEEPLTFSLSAEFENENYDYMIGSSVSGSPQSITFNKGVYQGNAFEGEGEWTLENWEGGMLTLSINLYDMTVSLVDEQTVGVNGVKENGIINYSNGVITAYGTSSIKVINTRGQVVASTNEDVLDINNLPKDVYIVVAPGCKSIKVAR